MVTGAGGRQATGPGHGGDGWVQGGGLDGYRWAGRARGASIGAIHVAAIDGYRRRGYRGRAPAGRGEEAARLRSRARAGGERGAAAGEPGAFDPGAVEVAVRGEEHGDRGAGRAVWGGAPGGAAATGILRADGAAAGAGARDAAVGSGERSGGARDGVDPGEQRGWVHPDRERDGGGDVARDAGVERDAAERAAAVPDGVAPVRGSDGGASSAGGDRGAVRGAGRAGRAGDHHARGGGGAEYLLRCCGGGDGESEGGSGVTGVFHAGADPGGARAGGGAAAEGARGDRSGAAAEGDPEGASRGGDGQSESPQPGGVDAVLVAAVRAGEAGRREAVLDHRGRRLQGALDGGRGAADDSLAAPAADSVPELVLEDSGAGAAGGVHRVAGFAAGAGAEAGVSSVAFGGRVHAEPRGGVRGQAGLPEAPDGDAGGAVAEGADREAAESAVREAGAVRGELHGGAVLAVRAGGGDRRDAALPGGAGGEHPAFTGVLLPL